MATSRPELSLIECPRDAMQGIPRQIATDLKVKYLNSLLKVGFDVLDFGSFVSPKAVPQMADTAAVLEQLDLSTTQTELLAIVANERGAKDACQFASIQYLGYPFSISETFQVRNTRKTILESIEIVERMQELSLKHGKKLLIYLSMAFGNPYGDPWELDILLTWVERMVGKGIQFISLADTIGRSDPRIAQEVFSLVIPQFPEVTWSAHFHALPQDRRKMIAAAVDGGCRRIEHAIRGFGGCPFAKDELVGNISTESVLSYCKEENIELAIDTIALKEAMEISQLVFS